MPLGDGERDISPPASATSGPRLASSGSVVCLAFGVVDLAVEPSPLTASFAASQVPFAVGALALAKATYPENLNGATLSGASPASVTDEMILRGRLGFEAALEDELAGS